MAFFYGKRLSSSDAFTLAEAVVALAIIGIGVGAMVPSMSQLNQEASISRNVTGADAALQNQIDLLLSDGPFNPQKTGSDGQPQIPPELVVGTHTTNNVPIYREPNTGIIVSGTLDDNRAGHQPELFRPDDVHVSSDGFHFLQLSRSNLFRIENDD